MPILNRLRRSGARRARTLLGPGQSSDAAPVDGPPPKSQVPNATPAASPTPAPAPSQPTSRDRPDPPEGAQNFVLLVLDSCRFDSFVKARPRWMPKLGEVQRRYSYATWTAPSHFNLLMGLMPHPSPRGVFASDYYRGDFLQFRERLGVPGVNFSGMLPQLWMPHYLQAELGYRTGAVVSMPVLNPATPLAAGFDHFVMADRHNDLNAMLDQVSFDADRPSFWLLNTGETHYPYAGPDEPESDWPRIHGVNGVFKQVAAGRPLHKSDAPRFFDQARLDALRRRQVDAVGHVDRVMERLFDMVPANTWITITSDHGELFGEGGYFGHGPILHDKVLEVPFVEGRLR